MLTSKTFHKQSILRFLRPVLPRLLAVPKLDPSMASSPSLMAPWSPSTSPLLPLSVPTTSPPREPLLDHLAQLHLPWSNSTMLLDLQVMRSSTMLKVPLGRRHSITLLDPLEPRPSTRLLARLVTSPSTTLKALLEWKLSTMLLDLLEPSLTTMLKALQELWSLSTTTLDLSWSLSITTLDLAWSLSITTLDLEWNLSIIQAHMLLLLPMRMMVSATLVPSTSTSS